MRFKLHWGREKSHGMLGRTKAFSAPRAQPRARHEVQQLGGKRQNTIGGSSQH
jgi:hypothetical protein